PILVLDAGLRVQRANTPFYHEFHVTPEETDNRLVYELGNREWEIPRLRSLLEEILPRNTRFENFEVEHEFPKLGHRIMLLNAQQIRWESQAPKALLLSIEDITERRKLERALQQSEERFRVLFESAHDAIVIVNQAGKIDFANRQSLAWFGYAPGELEGKPIEVLIPARFLDRHVAHRDRYMAKPDSRPMGRALELFARRKDGTEFPVEVSLSPLETHAETKVTAMIRDISETRKLSSERERLLEMEKNAHGEAERARTEAERANEAKDLFLATLSHELRTPLTTILGWAQLLRKGPVNAERVRRGLEAIERGATTQAQLINDLLDVSRILSGKLALNLTEVDPIEVARGAIEATRLLADGKKVVLELIAAVKIGKVRGDPARLQQAVWNLLTNAIKFSPEGGRVEIHVDHSREHGHDYAAVRVVDHGKGIDPAFLPSIFTRFSQQDSTSTRVHGGLGIGLALVRDLVTGHGGSVKAESAGNGKGATFTILLPLISETGARQSPSARKRNGSSEAAPDLTGVKVLIVDDEPGSLEAFSEMVKAFGGQVVSCSSSKDALAALEAQHPQVLVSDIAMPGEDGYALIRKIRALSAEHGGLVPALALTAYAGQNDVERAITAGFQEHLAKPVDGKEFARSIARLAAVGRTLH
ncbi:MAG TPA: PAS domain S-box protein, partial [Bdellovibrionota bacterium]|nr:PAS domain S-box protein [Bdellovibrionota bacterium]